MIMSWAKQISRYTDGNSKSLHVVVQHFKLKCKFRVHLQKTDMIFTPYFQAKKVIQWRTDGKVVEAELLWHYQDVFYSYLFVHFFRRNRKAFPIRWIIVKWRNHFPSWINTEEKQRGGQWAGRGENGNRRSAPGETHQFSFVISPRWGPRGQRALRSSQHLLFSQSSSLLFGNNAFEVHGDACQYLLKLDQLNISQEFAHLRVSLHKILLALRKVHAQLRVFLVQLALQLSASSTSLSPRWVHDLHIPCKV